MKQLSTVQKIARLRTLSILHEKQRMRIANADKRIMGFHREQERLLRSISKKECALYAEKIAKYICA